MKSLKNLSNNDLNIQLNERLYQSEINRKNPTAILFLIDQSQSMSFAKTKYKDEYLTYAQILAKMINNLFDELIGRCTKQEGIRDYFNVSILGYGGASADTANVLWEGNLKGKTWVSISELKENAMYRKEKVTKNIRGKIKEEEIDVPYWFNAVANYQTPMGDAFDKGYNIIKEWIKDNHENSYPPVVINITDGLQSDCTDEEIIAKSKKLQTLNTKDGYTLVLNCHISENNRHIVFPYSENEIPADKYAQMLYEMSSVMPDN